MSRAFVTPCSLAVALAVLGACQATATDQPAAEIAVDLTLDKVP